MSCDVSKSIGDSTKELSKYPQTVIVNVASEDVRYPRTSRSDDIPAYPAGRAGKAPIYVQGLQPIDLTRSGQHRRGNRERGRADAAMIEDMGDTFDWSFMDTKIRNRFVQRVYTILGLQLLITALIIGFIILYKPAKDFARTNVIALFTSLGIFIVIFFVLMCIQKARRTFPANIILLGILTLAMSYMSGATSAQYDTMIVLTTTAITAAIVILVSIFAIQTKWDITNCGTCFCIMGMIMMLLSIVTTIVFFTTGSKFMFIIYSALAAIFFMLYLMYDTQQIMGGRRIQLSPEEYIAGALSLYVDIMQIFLHMMRLMGYLQCRR